MSSIKFLGGGSGLDLVPQRKMAKMDNRNVFVAVHCPCQFYYFGGAFFDTPPPTVTKKVQSSIGKEDNSLSQNQITPNINQEKIVTEVSRKDSLVKVDRVIIDNENISGSVSLKGAIFDDISNLKIIKRF